MSIKIEKEGAHMSSADVAEIGWAVVGASFIAEHVVIPAINRNGGSLVRGVLSSSPQRGTEFAQRTGLATSYRSLDELLSDPAVQIVYVSTTNDLHEASTIAALEAGKHVLCEKPLAMSVEEAAAMVAAADRAGRALGTLHHFPALSHVRRLRELVQAGAIGEVVSLRLVAALDFSGMPRSWRFTDPQKGAGPVLDLATHGFDLARFVLDDDLIEVTAIGRTRGLTDPPISDDVQFVGATRGGIIVTGHASYVVNRPNVIEVVGRGGILTTELGGAMGIGPMSVTLVPPGGEPADVSVDPYQDPFEASIDGMVAAARGDGAPFRSGRDGERSLAAALAVLDSIRSGRREVVVGPVSAENPS